MSKYIVPGSCHRKSEAIIITRTQATAVPKKTARNSGLIIATLMDCMAPIPSADGRRARAFITAAEKAKKSPAINPQPSAATSVMVKVKPSLVVTKGCLRAFVSLIPLGSITVLVSLAAVAVSWRSGSKQRQLAVIAALCALLVMGSYPVFFAETNASFIAGGLSDSAVRAL